MSSVGIEDKGEMIIAHLNGDLYIENMKEVEQILNEQISKHPKVMAMDCKNLAYIDSSAIAALVRLVRNGMKKNIELVFFDLNSSILQIFETVNLDKFFSLMARDKFMDKYKGYFSK